MQRKRLFYGIAKEHYTEHIICSLLSRALLKWVHKSEILESSDTPSLAAKVWIGLTEYTRTSDPGYKLVQSLLGSIPFGVGYISCSNL